MHISLFSLIIYLAFKMFLKEVSYAHQCCLFGQKFIKLVKYYYNFNIF